MALGGGGWGAPAIAFLAGTGCGRSSLGLSKPPLGQVLAACVGRAGNGRQACRCSSRWGRRTPGGCRCTGGLGRWGRDPCTAAAVAAVVAVAVLVVAVAAMAVAAAVSSGREALPAMQPPLALALPWFPAEITWLPRFHGESRGGRCQEPARTPRLLPVHGSGTKGMHRARPALAPRVVPRLSWDM